MAVDDDDGTADKYYLTDADKAKPAPKPQHNTTEALPEGFFDDPVADAKVCNIFSDMIGFDS